MLSTLLEGHLVHTLRVIEGLYYPTLNLVLNVLFPE